MKKLLLLGLMVAIAMPAFGATANKTGEPIEMTPPAQNNPSPLRSDFEYSTCGQMDCIPDLGGSATGWAEWSITQVVNDTGHDLVLTEFGFPMCGPTTGAYGWLVWADQPSLPGPASTADFFGAFTPICTDPTTFPPTVYTYVNVASQNIVIANGTSFWFGFDNTGMQGMTSYNGFDTYGWYAGAWDYDAPYGRTVIMQLKADYFGGGTPVETSTWGTIKSLYR